MDASVYRWAFQDICLLYIGKCLKIKAEEKPAVVLKPSTDGIHNTIMQELLFFLSTETFFCKSILLRNIFHYKLETVLL